MGHLSWLSEAPIRRIAPCSPQSHGMPRVDDRRMISAIIFVTKNGLRWRDAPRECGPHMIIYNRFVRRSQPGVFNRIFPELTAKGQCPND